MTDHRIETWDDQPLLDTDSTAQVDRGISRREVLRLGLVGGAATLATQQVAQRLGEGRTAEQLAALEAELRAQAAAEIAAAQEVLQTRVRRLEQELALYRALERTGLDKLITLLLDTWDTAWRGIRAVAAHLRGGVESADQTLQRWDERLSTLREALRFWGGLLDGIEEQIERVRALLGGIIKHTGPIGETVEGFFDWLLGRIPFGWGTSLRDGAEGVTGVMTGLPLLLKDSREQVLQPLTEEWVAEEQGLSGGLFEPLRSTLLVPLQAHLAHIEALAEGWESQTAAPLRQALAERAAVQTKIAALQATEPLALFDDQDGAIG